MTAFDWNSLPKGAVVVDVGGGVGTSSLVLAKKTSDINIVVQDRLSVIQEGNEVCNYCIHLKMRRKLVSIGLED